jgi:hypothetical protein
MALMTADELDKALDIMDLFRADVPIPEIARRVGIPPSRVRRELARFADRLWAPQAEEKAEPDVPRCVACEIVLCAAWTSWDDQGLCEHCQWELARIVELTGLGRAEAFRLWAMPTPSDPAQPSALERYLEERGEAA